MDVQMQRPFTASSSL